jgi:hypothetical protein
VECIKDGGQGWMVAIMALKIGLLKKQGQIITTNASEQVKVEQVQCLK